MKRVYGLLRGITFMGSTTDILKHDGADHGAINPPLDSEFDSMRAPASKRLDQRLESSHSRELPPGAQE